MANIDIILPKMGESVTDATILKWLKKEGDKVEADEPLAEIATDKVDSEVPSTTSGILKKRLFEEGQVVQVGSVIAVIETPGGSEIRPVPVTVAEDKPVAVPADTPNGSAFRANAAAVSLPVSPAGYSKRSQSGRFYSPLVRNIARQEGVSMQDLENIPGSGEGGRLTKKDILAFIPLKKQASPQVPASAVSSPALTPPSVVPSPVLSGEHEIVEMDRMRKLIAEHMVMSKHTSPHVTSFVEADVTGMVTWREKVKAEFEKREKEKITFTPIFIEAVVKAIRDFPMINVSIDGSRIIVKRNINIGMATALPSGNLIVPVIKKADHLNLLGLTRTVNDLASRARANKLKPDEIQDGTFTITNVGTFGNLMGTPIINQPQVAILATGSIKKKPVVIESPEGDTIGIRHMMFLSLSYDHRVVDGALGGSFLRRIADYLEKFDVNRIL